MFGGGAATGEEIPYSTNRLLLKNAGFYTVRAVRVLTIYAIISTYISVSLVSFGPLVNMFLLHRKIGSEVQKCHRLSHNIVR